MAKRKTWGDPDDQALRRLIRKLRKPTDRNSSAAREELKKLVDRVILREDFDDAVLPFLVEMENQDWKYQRSYEARKFRRANPKLFRDDQGRRIRLFTREDFIRADVEMHFPDLSTKDKDAIARRLKRKLRERMYKTSK